MRPLEADAIIACLHRHHVRYVLIGGLAAILHGSPQVTFDADICPARDAQNLERLAAALREMGARVRAPDVPEGYSDLVRSSRTMSIKGHPAPVAALEDVIRSKEAAGRPKDQAALPLLRQLLQQGKPQGDPKQE